MSHRLLSLVGILLTAVLISPAAPATPAAISSQVGPAPRLVEIDAGDGTLIVVRAADAEAWTAKLRASQLRGESEPALQAVAGSMPVVEAPSNVTWTPHPALGLLPGFPLDAARGNRQGRVIGSDDRKRVRKTQKYPASATAYVFITTSGGGGGKCSGSLVGRSNLLITAAHCIYDTNAGEFFADWFIAPGAKSAGQMPFGSCGWQAAVIHKKWKAGTPKYDVGAIVLDCNVGDQTGWLGAMKSGGNDFIGGQHVIHQYPGDKPTATQWQHKGPWSFTNGNRAFYTMDTAGGSSGSPVMQKQPNKTYNTNATHAYGGTTHNSGATWWKGVWKVLKRGIKLAK
jgi:V8-like Glu-specific endopeptidase